jgi:hypothetical protein
MLDEEEDSKYYKGRFFFWPSGEVRQNKDDIEEISN